MNLTTKQIELMRVIVASNGDASGCDLDEILERVRYDTTKASLQFSIRALVAHKMIEKLGVEKRRGRQRQVIGATELGRAIMKGGLGPTSIPVVSTVEDDLLDAELDVL